nr:hypothetical protein [uncultured Allomuricauda sp.]
MFLLISSILTESCHAQIENISIGEEVTMDRLYAGLLSTTGFFGEESGNSNLSSIQLGARIHHWIVPGKLKIRSFGVVQFIENRDTKYFKNYEVIFTPKENFAVHLGSMATPTTELRPNPVTWQSQVVTNAERLIPGGKPGLKIRYDFTNNLGLTLGIHNSENKATPHLKISYKQFEVSGFLKDDKLFSAAKLRYQNGYLIATKSDNSIAISSIIPYSKEYRFYIDLSYSKEGQDLTFGEFGFRRYFPTDHLIKGFLSLNYNSRFKGIQGGLFIHI